MVRIIKPFIKALAGVWLLSAALISVAQAAGPTLNQHQPSGGNTEATGNKLAPGMRVPDFSLPAHNGWGQRLAEMKGQALVLIWLDDCDRCEERLAPYQLLAEGLKQDGLNSWFIWTPDGDDRPPRMRLPVLIADKKWRTGWQFADRPAIMLINADGVLEQLLLGDLSDNFSRLEILLPQWLANMSRLNR